MIRFLLNRIAALFIFALVHGAGGALAVQMFYVLPKKQCLKEGNEWIEAGHDVPRGFANKCAVDVRSMPILPTLTVPGPAAAAPAPAMPAPAPKKS